METIDGSAVEGEDYEPVNEILTFEPREREKEVSIWLLQRETYLTFQTHFETEQ